MSSRDFAKRLLCSQARVHSRSLLRDPFRFGAKRTLRLVFIGACMLLSSVGMLAFGALVGYIGMGLCLALVVVEITMSVSAQTGVEKLLENAQPCACMFTGVAGAATTGLWKGIRVQVGSSGDGLRIGVPLRDVPAEVVIEQRSPTCNAEHGVRTGDELFDQSLCVGKSDDDAWRCVLSSRARMLLRSLADQAVTGVHGQALDIQLLSLESKKLRALVDLAVAFAAALPEPATDPCEMVFSLARTEPMSGVRDGHYRWLAARGWNTHEVYRAAAADPDAAIAEWGSNHVAPSDGVFR